MSFSKDRHRQCLPANQHHHRGQETTQLRLRRDVAIANRSHRGDRPVEWLPAAEAAAKAAATDNVEIRDSAGNVLADGDSVITIKDLKVKGAGQTLKKGTVIKAIRLTGDLQEIDCRYEGIKGLVLRAEFVRKR